MHGSRRLPVCLPHNIVCYANQFEFFAQRQRLDSLLTTEKKEGRKSALFIITKNQLANILTTVL